MYYPPLVALPIGGFLKNASKNKKDYYKIPSLKMPGTKGKATMNIRSNKRPRSQRSK